MIKDFNSYIPVTTIGVIYFFACGGLYLIGFWTTFDFDVSGLVSVTDIPKSFVFPFVITNVVYFLNILMLDIIAKSIHSIKSMRDDSRIERKKSQKVKLNLLYIAISSFDYITLVLFAIGILSFNYKPYNISFWIGITGAFSFLFFLRFQKSDLISKAIPSPRFRLYVSYLVCWFPVLAFSSGKINSLRIHNGIEYQKVSRLVSNEVNVIEDSLLNSKLLGFIGDKIILSSSINKSLIILSQDKVSEIQFTLITMPK